MGLGKRGLMIKERARDLGATLRRDEGKVRNGRGGALNGKGQQPSGRPGMRTGNMDRRRTESEAQMGPEGVTKGGNIGGTRRDRQERT